MYGSPHYIWSRTKSLVGTTKCFSQQVQIFQNIKERHFTILRKASHFPKPHTISSGPESTLVISILVPGGSIRAATE